MATTCVRLVRGLMMVLSIVASDAITCHQCNYTAAAAAAPHHHQQLLSNCRLPPPLPPSLDSSAEPVCEGQFCQSIVHTSSDQSVPTIYLSCIDLASGITVEHCLQYRQVLGIAFFLFENQCCYSVTNTTESYTHCFCHDDFCNYNVTQPVPDEQTNMTKMTSPLPVQLKVMTQSPPNDDAQQQQPVTCYDCKYSVTAGVVVESTCSEPFISNGISTCSEKACYNYAYVEEDQYTVIRGCDAEENFDFQSVEECLQYGQIYNGTFFFYNNQCCYTVPGRLSVLTVCYCHSDLCNSNVSRPVLAPDTSTTVSRPPPVTTFNLSTFTTVVARNSTQADPLLSTPLSKRYTPPISLKSSVTATEPTDLSLRNTRATPPMTSLTTASRPLDNTRTTTTTVRASTPSMTSIACYNCSYFPNSESSADESVCRGPSGTTPITSCTGRACYVYVYTSDKGISVIDRNCDKEGTVVFQSDAQCLQYGSVYNLTFFTFEQQCCYNTDVSGGGMPPVTVCFCNTDLCNSNRFRPTPQTATTTLTTSNPLPDIPPSFKYNTTTSGSNVSTTRASTLNTSSIGTPSITVASSSLWTSDSVTQVSSDNIASTASRTTTTTSSPSYPTSSLSSTHRTSPMLSNATTTRNRQVTCYVCIYSPDSDPSGTSLCNNYAALTDLPTCVGRSCYTYAYVSQQGTVIYRACDAEGTLEYQSDDQCLQYSQVHHLPFFTYQHQCCYITSANGLPVTVCFCNDDLCNSNRSRPTKKR